MILCHHFMPPITIMHCEVTQVRFLIISCTLAPSKKQKIKNIKKEDAGDLVSFTDFLHFCISYMDTNWEVTFICSICDQTLTINWWNTIKVFNTISLTLYQSLYSWPSWHWGRVDTALPIPWKHSSAAWCYHFCWGLYVLLEGWVALGVDSKLQIQKRTA